MEDRTSRENISAGCYDVSEAVDYSIALNLVDVPKAPEPLTTLKLNCDQSN
jgi:hypothetical protein